MRRCRSWDCWKASGLRFDQLWVVDMHSQNFPASVAINQLLPAEFQRLHQMPHSLPERELEIAHKLLQGYKNNSGRLIVSYPKLRGEEQLDPSPLNYGYRPLSRASRK